MPENIKVCILAFIILLVIFTFYRNSLVKTELRQVEHHSPPTAVIEQGSGVEAASYIIFRDNEGIVYAKNGSTGAIQFSGTDASTVIQSAINALTSGRTWKEKVVLKGNFTLNSAVSIPSYTVLEIQGKLTLGNAVNDHVIKNSDPTGGNTEIEIRGGVIDGNYANQTSGVASDGIHLQKCTKVTVQGVHVKDTRRYGIQFYNSQDGMIIDSLVENGQDDDNIAVTDGSSRVLIKGTISKNCQAQSGIEVDTNVEHISVLDNLVVGNKRGIMVHCTHSTSDYARKILIKNNIVYDVKTDWGILCQGLATGNNVEDVTIEGNLIDTIAGIGIELENVAGGKVIGNTVINTTDVGIVLDDASRALIQGNVIKDCGTVAVRKQPIYTDGASPYCVVTNNIMSDTRTGTSRTTLGPDLNDDDMLIIGNQFYNLYGHGIDVDGHRCIIVGNRAYGNLYDGIRLRTKNNCIIEDNILTDNGNWGILISAYANNTIVRNNQLLNNTSGQISDSGTGTKISGNIGFVTEKSGNATVANNDWFSHGLATTPKIVTLTPINGTYSGVPVVMGAIDKNSTHVKVSVYWTNGTAITTALQTYWYAEV